MGIVFTLSQSGMVRHWWKLRAQQKGWQRSLAINALGALTTLVVALVIASTKFLEGAWIVVLLIPLLVVTFGAISRHYQHVERMRTTDIPIHPKDIRHRLIVPVAELSQASRQSLAYARSISPYVTAVHVTMHRSKAGALRTAWKEWQGSFPEHEQSHLDVIEPAGRSLVNSLLGYIDSMHQQYPDETLTIILPGPAGSALLSRMFSHPLISRLKLALFFRPGIVVTSMSWHQPTNDTPVHARDIRHRFIVPIADLDRASVQSLAYARSISPYVTAAHVAIDPQDVERVRSKWQLLQKHLTPEEETQLVVIESPYRSLARPLLAYIDTVHELHPEDTLTVILPEFVVAHWWEYPLHNQTAFQLKAALLARPGIVVTDIPQHLRSRS